MSTPPELARLLDQPAAPDIEARWADFVGTHSRLLLHTARAVTTDGDSAMDAYTYILEQLRKDDFHRLRAFSDDGRARFSTWLVVVARRLCLDYRRTRYGRHRADIPELERTTRRRLQDLVSAEVDPASIPDADPAAADAVLLREETNALLDNALVGLSPRERLLLTLRFEDGESVPRIARLLSYPTPFHVYRQLNALLARLRKQLQEKGIDGPGP